MSIFPFGRSPTKVVSLKLIFTWLAAVDVAAPRCGFVASSRTFKEAIACNCVAFSSTLPAIKPISFQLCAKDQVISVNLPSCIGSMVWIISCNRPCLNLAPVTVAESWCELPPGTADRVSDAALDVTEPPGWVAIEVSDEFAALFCIGNGWVCILIVF